MFRYGGLLLWFLFSNGVASQVGYDVTCSEKTMEVSVVRGDAKLDDFYVEGFRDFEGCTPVASGDNVIFKLPLDNFHQCGTVRMRSKQMGHQLFYNRILIDRPEKNVKEELLAKCKLPKETPLSRGKRDILPVGFGESEDLNITNIVAHAPTPYLNLAIRQNGRLLDTRNTVQPGTMLEMVIYLDSKSSEVYGILGSYLKVTDGTPEHDEVIVMNGCSIDPYIFGNFETDSGKTLSSKFRAFKFPNSNYVLFVGTVNICLNQCRGVPCGNDKVGYGRKKREIPAEMPFDPNKLYEVEMTTVLKVEFSPNHFQPKREQVQGTYDYIHTNDENAYMSNGYGSLTGTISTLITLIFLFIKHTNF